MEIRHRLTGVFGVAYFAEAWSFPQKIEDLERSAWNLIETRKFQSFRIDTRRADKTFPLTSVEINQRVGAYVKERCGERVDLENAELTCWIEVVEKYALIYVDRLAGPGRPAFGTSGKVVVLLSGGLDSPVAAWKMMKRGCTAIFVHFHSFPYTNKESQEKAKQLAPAAFQYQLRSRTLPRAVCRNSAAHHGGDAGGNASDSLPAIHDADCREDRLARKGPSPRDRRQRRAGGISDDREYRCHLASCRRCRFFAR